LKIALVCAGGISTSILSANMKAFADKEDQIEALGWQILEDEIDRFDVVLVGPQITFQFEKIKKLAEQHKKKAAQIDGNTFCRMDGKTAVNLAKQALSE
jgi:PTS system cellobiose-specific IIB component